MTAPFTPRITDLTPGPDARTSAAQAVLTLTRVALAAPDLLAGISPTLEHLVGATAAVGAAYLEWDGKGSYRVRAAWGEVPPRLSAPQGLGADTPLLRALAESARPLLYDGTGGAEVLPGLGVTSLAATPVRVGDGPLLGALVMYTGEAHVWDSEEAALLSMVSGTLAPLTARLVAEEQTQAAREAALRALGQMLEAWDGESHGHTDRAAHLATRLAERLDLPPARRQALRWGAYLHDLGKVTLLGAELPRLEGPGEGDGLAHLLGLLPPAARSVLTDRFEHWGGGGYPSGKAGTGISLEARLFALCDTYDALTHPRPCDVAWEPEEALAELRARAGREFDPELVALLARVVAETGAAEVVAK
ncbi:HD domain-containing phosphohydrolase [Deinococcus sp. YIM 134068]|uniref:HD domain-containing phosphohydrolase n=1 Tax=Deinococcus lichenicola TaxID=3118910 RepID=UPI002F92CFFB